MSFKKTIKYFKNSREEIVYTVSHTVDNAKANILIVNGINEYTSRYQGFVNFLNHNGFNVFQFDHCGFGYSSGERGYINSIEDWLEDFQIGLNRTLEYNNLKTIIISHSFGATLSFNFLGKNYTNLGKWNIVGSIHSAAVYEVKVFKALQLIAPLISLLHPRWSPRKKFSDMKLLKDKELEDEVVNDPIYYNEPLKARLGYNILKMSMENKILYPNISHPIFLLHGEKDSITDTVSIHKIFDCLINTKNKYKKTYSNTDHDTFTDYSRQEAMDDCLNFILKLI